MASTSIGNMCNLFVPGHNGYDGIFLTSVPCFSMDFLWWKSISVTCLCQVAGTFLLGLNSTLKTTYAEFCPLPWLNGNTLMQLNKYDTHKVDAKMWTNLQDITKHQVNSQHQNPKNLKQRNLQSQHHLFWDVLTGLMTQAAVDRNSVFWSIYS